MPHTNRKKKNVDSQKKVIVHTKRKEVLDEEGWTHVIDKPQPKAIPSIQKPERKGNANLWSIAADFRIGDAYYVDRTLEEYEVDFDRARKTWGKSEACRQLKVLLEGKTGEEREIGNVVVLGLGSLQNARGEGRKASWLQLVALRDLVEGLGDEDIKFTFQDPAFTELDIEYLRSLEYEVVSHPEAFERINEKTLVYAIHCYAEIYEKVARQGGGKIIVCTDVEEFGGPSSIISESSVKILQVMVDGYEKIEFPQIRNDFSDTKIYWRREGSSVPLIPEAKVTKDINVTAEAGRKTEGSVVPEKQSDPTTASEDKAEEPMEANGSDPVPAPEEKVEEHSQPTEESIITVSSQPAPEENLSTEAAQTPYHPPHSAQPEEWTVIDTEPKNKSLNPEATEKDATINAPEAQIEEDNKIEETQVEVQEPKLRIQEPKAETQEAKPEASNPQAKTWVTGWLTWWGLWDAFA